MSCVRATHTQFFAESLYSERYSAWETGSCQCTAGSQAAEWTETQEVSAGVLQCSVYHGHAQPIHLHTIISTNVISAIELEYLSLTFL